MNIVDLHTHSNKSDGSLSPTELVHYALKKGLKALALTDHDTFSGLDEAILAAQNTNLEIIPGIEFSTEYQGRDIHILGLLLDYKKEEFLKQVEPFLDSREIRNQRMCEKLTTAGLPISYIELQEMFPGAVITRSHFARFMLNKGYIKELSTAFTKYIGDHCPYFVGREKVRPEDAIALIHQAGGLAMLAHPTLYSMTKKQLDLLVAHLKEHGLDGMEVIYSTYSPSEERDMKKLAMKYQLLFSGGSDFHGLAKPSLELATGYGKLFIPEEILLKLKERLTHDNTNT